MSNIKLFGHLFPAIIAVFLLLFVSCSKNEVFDGEGKTSLSMNLIGESSTESNSPSLKENASPNATLKGISTFVEQKRYSVKLDEKHELEVVLTPVDSKMKISSDASKQFTNTKSAVSATAQQAPLASNVSYQVAIYKGQNLIQQKEFTPNGPNTPFTGLDAGTGYTIVAYSFGSTSVTALDPAQSLNAATVALSSTNRFMHFVQQNITLSANADNKVDVVLDNKIAEIKSLTMNVASTAIEGNITTLNNVAIGSGDAGAAKMIDGTLQFSSLISKKHSISDFSKCQNNYFYK